MPADRGKHSQSVVVSCSRWVPIAQYTDPKYKWPCSWDGCDKWFTREYDMKRHIGNVHLKERHECIYAKCTYTATQESNLTAHINKVHKNNKRPYSCVVPGCPKAYGDPSALSRHKRRCIDEYCAENSLDVEEFKATLPRKKAAGKRYPNVPAHVERILESDDPNPASAATLFGSFRQVTPPVQPSVPATPAVPVPPIVALVDREPSPESEEIDELFDTPEPPSCALALPSPAASLASSSSSILNTPLSTPHLDVKQEIKVEDPLHWVWDNYFDLTAAADSPVLPPVSLPAAADVKPDVADLFPASNSTGNLFGQPTTTVDPVVINQMLRQTTFVDPAPIIQPFPMAYNVPVKMEEIPVMLNAPMKAEPGADVHINLNSNAFMPQDFAGMQQPFQPTLSPPMLMPNSMPMSNSMPLPNSMSMPNFGMGMGVPNSDLFQAANEFAPQYNFANGMPMGQFMPQPRLRPLSANPYAHLLFNPNPFANQFNGNQGFF
ncbi:unnamed protein product [Cyclocybe aegerita]|uniref:C2H2-type domain-containing protein n=1 Tax=Cyclocybe aegerita TaxID=1973307 RepID=A0A8S0VRQ3_CYCAE|nr:unnamed protein product [Cyclocybe aegerita]